MTMSKRKLLVAAVLVIAAVLLATVILRGCFPQTFTPFSDIEREDVVSVEIDSTRQSDGSSTVVLEEAYAMQVLLMLRPIRLHLPPSSADWLDGAHGIMFYVNLTDGRQIRVGENGRYFVMDGTCYRMTDDSEQYLTALSALYWAHPDHCPPG